MSEPICTKGQIFEIPNFSLAHGTLFPTISRMAAPVNPPERNIGCVKRVCSNSQCPADGCTEIVDSAKVSVALKLENPYSA